MSERIVKLFPLFLEDLSEIESVDISCPVFQKIVSLWYQGVKNLDNDLNFFLVKEISLS